MKNANDCKKNILPGKLWEMSRDETLDLKRFVVQIWSLTCSSSVCESNLSLFEMVIEAIKLFVVSSFLHLVYIIIKISN